MPVNASTKAPTSPSRPASDAAASATPAGQPFGAPGEAVHVVRAEVDPGNGGEHPRDLVGVEGEVVGAELLQLAGGAQPAEREGRIPAGGDDDVDVLGHPFHEERRRSRARTGR